jgi:aspartyl-tRNA(Asn)/glutamyl-tRNA(Gln) amidotransferase subunit A
MNALGSSSSSPDARSLTAYSAAAMIREGQLTSEAVVEALLARIDATDDRVMAYITVCRDSALKEARKADARLKEKKQRRVGPLHGVPVSVKDLIETKGIRTTAGSKLLPTYVPNRDATVVERLKAAGAIVIGKTNTHEFALGGVSPPTRNPWNLGRIPGGSSGGSAAAIATGSALTSLGSDTGGSIRIPASYCGVVGLKPTYGRVSRTGVFPESWSFDHVGPITRTVQDCALVLGVIAGRDPLDTTTSGRPVPDYLSDMQPDIEGLRVGVPENYFFEPIERGVRSAVNRAIKDLARLGAKVEHFHFPMADEILGAHTIIDLAESSAYHEDSFRERAGDYQPDVRALLEQGFLIPAVDYIRAQRWRGVFFPRMRSLFKEIDLIVTPSQPMTAPKHGAGTLTLDGREIDVNMAMTRFMAPFNFTGQPALSINCGFSNGLPVGLQIVADHFEEGKILSAATAYERATRWHLHQPEI